MKKRNYSCFKEVSRSFQTNIKSSCHITNENKCKKKRGRNNKIGIANTEEMS